MSDEEPPYNQLYITAWTALSILFALFFLALLVFGQHIRDTFHWVWDLVRYLASPII